MITSATRRSETSEIDSLAFTGYTALNELKFTLDDVSSALKADKIYSAHNSYFCTAPRHPPFLLIKEVS